MLLAALPPVSFAVVTTAAAAASAIAATTTQARARGLTRPTIPLHALAILLKAMATYRELLAQVKSEISEVDAAHARELLEESDSPLFIDVRAQDEWDEGHIPDALHIPRGNLESRVESRVPDRSTPLVL